MLMSGFFCNACVGVIVNIATQEGKQFKPLVTKNDLQNVTRAKHSCDSSRPVLIYL